MISCLLIEWFICYFEMESYKVFLDNLWLLKDIDEDRIEMCCTKYGVSNELF